MVFMCAFIFQYIGLAKNTMDPNGQNSPEGNTLVINSVTKAMTR